MAHIKTRDLNMVAIINGATKAAVFPDMRKHTNKYAARGKNKMSVAQTRRNLVSDVTFEYERDTDLYRIYADLSDNEVDIVHIALLDDDLNEGGRVNPSSFNEEEWAEMENLARKAYNADE